MADSFEIKFRARNIDKKNVIEMAQVLARAYTSEPLADHWTIEFMASATLLNLPKRYKPVFEREIFALGAGEMFET